MKELKIREKSTIIVEDFNKHFTVTGRIIRQKKNHKGIEDLNPKVQPELI